MRGKSSRSAGAILDKKRRILDLRRSAASAQARLPAVRRVILFGSLAAGSAASRSDADILVVVESSTHEQPRDRVPQVLQALSPLPCPLDLFVLTQDELERGRTEGLPLLRVALETGIDLL